MSTNPPKIAIIGAGPGGCTLARLLHLSAIPFKIFEAELTPDFRSQGGTLDLHKSTGLLAIKKAKLHDEFIKLARFDGDALCVADKKLLRYLDLKNSNEGSVALERPEIDRKDLRRLLLDSLPENVVCWGKKLKRANPGNLELEFENGEIEGGFDLVVGCDGAWSKVRSTLSDKLPFYSGIGGYSLSIPNASERFPGLVKLVNNGSLYCLGDGKSIMSQQLRDGSINIGIWGVRSEDWMKEAGFDVWNGKQVKEALLKEYYDWSDELRAFIEAFDEDTFAPRSLFMLPVDFTWEHRPGVTLLGDAAHVMTPFAGEGVNAAMLDAVELADAIVAVAKRDRGKGELSVAVRSHEINMRRRTYKVMCKTRDLMQLNFFTEGAPRTTIVRWAVRGMSDEKNFLLVFCAKVLLSVYFFFFRLLH